MLNLQIEQNHNNQNEHNHLPKRINNKTKQAPKTNKTYNKAIGQNQFHKTSFFLQFYENNKEQ